MPLASETAHSSFLKATEQKGCFISNGGLMMNACPFGKLLPLEVAPALTLPHTTTFKRSDALWDD